MEDTLREGGRQPGLRLIETVLWTGTAAPRWPLHRARIARSADALGWPAHDLPPPPAPPQPARLRLTLDAAGDARWEVHPLPASRPLWSLALAPDRLSSADPWLRHKTSRRDLYDRTRAALPAGIDETVFRNERDEICEGTITSVFFDRGAGLRTPPLASGLLPGVLRAELACPEEILRAEDLPRVRLWIGNALRGLIPARHVPWPDQSQSRPP